MTVPNARNGSGLGHLPPLAAAAGAPGAQGCGHGPGQTQQGGAEAVDPTVEKGRKGWILTMKNDETWGFLMDF